MHPGSRSQLQQSTGPFIIAAEALDARAQIGREAEQFVSMMFALWDEGGGGSLNAAGFDRAAHQHPLLVQAFQLEQLDLPPTVPTEEQASAGAPSTALAERRLSIKNGVYLGLRPGAVSMLDDSYF